MSAFKKDLEQILDRWKNLNLAIILLAAPDEHTKSALEILKYQMATFDIAIHDFQEGVNVRDGCNN